MTSVIIKGKEYDIDIKAKQLINIDNPKDIRNISDDDIDHYRSIVGVKVRSY